MSKNSVAERPTLKVWMQQHVNDINFLFIQSQTYLFNKVHMLAIQLPYFEFVHADYVYGFRSKLCHLLRNLPHLICQFQRCCFDYIYLNWSLKINMIKFHEVVHTINIWGPKPHGIVLISTGSHGIRLFVSPKKMQCRYPLLLLMRLLKDMNYVTCSNR